MNEILLTIEEFFELRTDIRNKKGIAPIVFYQDFDEIKKLWMRADDFYVYCEVEDASNPFYLSGLPYYNRVDEPDVLEIKSHNFCDNTKWLHGSSNSLFVIQPDPGKVSRIKRMQMITENDMVFPTNQIRVVLWWSLTNPCPAYVNGVKTNWDSNVDPLWVDLPTDGIQEFTNHVHIDMATGQPEYGVTVFTYENVFQLLTKSRFETVGDTKYFIRYLYEQEHIDLILKSSKNERMEIYTEQDLPLTSANSNPVGVASFMYDSYNEW